jgi:hypothetical protein
MFTARFESAFSMWSAAPEAGDAASQRSRSAAAAS